jgi:hypothetical protein
MNVEGMAEAERQWRVAQRLYMATQPDKPWSKLSWSDRRRFIDQSCQGEHRNENT